MVRIKVDHNIAVARALLRVVSMSNAFGMTWEEVIVHQQTQTALAQFHAHWIYEQDEDYIEFEHEQDLTMFLLKWG